MVIRGKVSTEVIPWAAFSQLDALPRFGSGNTAPASWWTSSLQELSASNLEHRLPQVPCKSKGQIDYSETRVDVSRNRSAQVDATPRERRPCTILNRI
jgi:hypothetical protein